MLFLTDEEVAMRMHRDYRAACKVLDHGGSHDHGWKHCPRKAYFLRRAKRQRERDAIIFAALEANDLREAWRGITQICYAKG